MTTLALDASTYAGSVAVLDGGRVLAEVIAVMRGEREERLMPAVAEALQASGVSPARLRRVVCGAGPGSFTSLRIAGSIAKGLAASLGVPLWAASSLALVVAGTLDLPRAGRYLAVLDAMRGEAYAQPFEVGVDGVVMALEPVSRVAHESCAPRAAELSAQLVGPGVPGHAAPHARGVARLSEGDLLAPVDLASWEPDYGRLPEAQVRWEQSHGRPLRVDL